MRHIRGRHALCDILGSTAGGMLATAVLQRSYWTGLVGVVLGVAAIWLDRINIEDEETELKGHDDTEPRNA